MTTVIAWLPPGRSVSFDDLTDAAVDMQFAADGRLEVTLTPDVSEEVARAVRIRVISTDDEDEARRTAIAELMFAPAEETEVDRAARLDELAVAVGRQIIQEPAP